MTIVTQNVIPASVLLQDGQPDWLQQWGSFAAEVLTNKGDTEEPYSPEDVRAKFRELAKPVWGGPHAKRVMDEVDAIDGASDICGLLDLLACSPQHGFSQ